MQAHSGIFQLLPLGLRVQDKIEKLIDKHMQSVGSQPCLTQLEACAHIRILKVHLGSPSLLYHLRIYGGRVAG